jgi:hypothetical protein
MNTITAIKAFLKPDDYLVIPDLHGTPRVTSAVDLVIELPNRTVQLGDFLDSRMPGCSSELALTQMMRLQALRPDSILLCGNHEAGFLFDAKAREPMGGYSDEFSISAYAEFMFKYGRIPPRIVDFVENLALSFEAKHLLFQHGGYEQERIGTDPSDIPLEDMISAYDVRPTWRGKKIVRGHLITAGKPIEHANHIDCEVGGWFPERAFCISIVSDTNTPKQLRGWIEIGEDGIALRTI